MCSKPIISTCYSPQGTKVAELNIVDSSIVCGVSQQEPSMPSAVTEDIPLAMQELLWGVVEKSAVNLNGHQQFTFRRCVCFL